MTERFLRYVVIDTQSDPTSPTCPSTEKQKDLGRLLAGELQAMGLSDAHLDAHGYVYATIPANTDKQVPVICFCSHMDTSPDCTGKDVKPQIVKNYRGGDIVLPADPTQVIRAADHPALKDQIGNDIITTDGTTLLGADNKAGLAEIMDAAHFLLNNPQIRHGAIKILFTPDEEIGRGVDKADLKKLGADFAYTMDGETAGNIEDETFSADGATITIEGVSTHPGFAKGKMEHAIKIAAAIVERLPKDTCSPETTEGRQGFLHPIGISGALEQATIGFIVRDFTDEGLKEKEALLESIVKDVMKGFPHSTYRLEIKPQYRNMKQVIDRHPEIIDNAMEAIRRTGLTPVKTSHPRRHRRLAAVVHGAALPQHLRRRARVSLAAGMGERAGHGKGRADHRASGDDLRGAGLRRAWTQNLENNPMHSRKPLLMIPLRGAANPSGSLRRHDPDRSAEPHLPARWRTAPASRGSNSSRRRAPRPAGLPARGGPGRFPARPPPPHRDRGRSRHRATRLHGSMAMPENPASPRMRCTRASEAKANGPGSSGPCGGSFGTCR